MVISIGHLIFLSAKPIKPTLFRNSVNVNDKRRDCLSTVIVHNMECFGLYGINELRCDIKNHRLNSYPCYYCFSAYQGTWVENSSLSHCGQYYNNIGPPVLTGESCSHRTKWLMAIRVREFVHNIVWFDKQNNLRTHVKLVYTGPIAIDQCGRHKNLSYTVNPVYITAVYVLTVCLTL